MLILFGVACVGVLVEAFVPAARRATASSSCWRCVGLVAALVGW